ncbi:hypothetical protein AB1E18_015295 [Capra hircus]
MAPLCHVSLALEEEMEHNQENLVYAPPQLPEKLHHRATLEQDVAYRYSLAWAVFSSPCSNAFQAKVLSPPMALTWKSRNKQNVETGSPPKTKSQLANVENRTGVG